MKRERKNREERRGGEMVRMRQSKSESESEGEAEYDDKEDRKATYVFAW